MSESIQHEITRELDQLGSWGVQNIEMIRRADADTLYLATALTLDEARRMKARVERIDELQREAISLKHEPNTDPQSAQEGM